MEFLSRKVFLFLIGLLILVGVICVTAMLSGFQPAGAVMFWTGILGAVVSGFTIWLSWLNQDQD